MGTPISERDTRSILMPKGWDEWEDMCTHIYRNIFFSGVPFGRSGQNQHGLDIAAHDFGEHFSEIEEDRKFLLSDYRATPGKGTGMVFIQCKYVQDGNLKYSAVKDGALRAGDLVRSNPGYRGVYLYIVATNARNDAALQADLNALKADNDLPFSIEVHSWDVICELVKGNNWLWESYGNEPGSDAVSDDSVEADNNASLIQSYLDENLLVEARKSDLERRNKLLGYGHGSSPKQTSEDVWKSSPPLRKVLLDLYTKAADSKAALELAKFEYGLDKLNADHCLAYYKLLRIAEHIPASDLPTCSTPRFSRWLSSLSNRLLDMHGSPDALACLALMLIMESDDPALQGKAFQMMTRIRDRDMGCEWEGVTRIAHAVVRYYYIMRRGWVPETRYWTIGDFTDSLTPGAKIDQPFAHENVKVRMVHLDPLGTTQPGAATLIDFLAADYSEEPNPLPKLKAECLLYSAPKYDDFEGYYSNTGTSGSCVANFKTLVTSIAARKHQVIFKDYSISITSLTFERLLGYRACLRAISQRLGGSSQDCFDKLRAIETIIGACRYAEDENFSLTKKRIWVTPVYDNPPGRLSEYSFQSGQFQFSPFTLGHEQIGYCQKELRSMNKHKRELFGNLYTARDNEFALCCLLALYRRRSILSYSFLDRHRAALMGIGSRYPYYPGELY